MGRWAEHNTLRFMLRLTAHGFLKRLPTATRLTLFKDINDAARAFLIVCLQKSGNTKVLFKSLTVMPITVSIQILHITTRVYFTPKYNIPNASRTYLLNTNKSFRPKLSLYGHVFQWKNNINDILYNNKKRATY